jgi:type IV pilus assembly protein PilO
MANNAKSANMDLNSVFGSAASQFRGLNPNEPGQWPWLPKVLAWFFLAVLMVVAGWFVIISDANNQLETERNKEPVLKKDYQNKLTQAVNLDELLKQKIQVADYVKQLEKQLPAKSEIDALLSDINSAGVGQGLQFELFKPGQAVVKDYYAELPIAIKVSGRYHSMGTFVAQVANLSRIVTLHNLIILAPKDAKDVSGNLIMEATAKTYRYLDPEEVEAQRKAAREAAAKAPGAKK